MKKGIVFISMALFIVISSGCALLPEEDEKLDPPIRPAGVTTYRTEPVRRGDIYRTVTMYCSFQSLDERVYRFETLSGRVKEVFVQRNDQVKAGDLIAILETGDLEVNLRDMQLRYEVARISYERARERHRNEQISDYDMQLAEIDYQIIKVRYDDLLEIDRQSRLYALEDGTVTFVINITRNNVVSNIATIARIANPDNLRLIGTGFSAREFKVGDRVAIEVFGRTENGTVMVAEVNRVEIIPDTMYEDWTIGTVGRVVLSVASANDVLMIRRGAVIQHVGTYVRVLEDGIPKEREIVTGLSDNTHIEVISGLKEGEEVILF